MRYRGLIFPQMILALFVLASAAFLSGCALMPETPGVVDGSNPSTENRDIVRKPTGLVDVEVVVRGGGPESFHQKAAQGEVRGSEVYDVVVVGGGLAGLSSAVYLTDAGKRVLLLEKEAEFGGLAAWGHTKDFVPYDRGASYWTDAYDEEMEILKHIGLGEYRNRNAIPEPIDSYYVRGEYFEEIWGEHTLEKLPSSFALFKFELKRANEDKLIPNQPFEEFAQQGGDASLDRFTAREWIEKMPGSIEEFIKKNEGNPNLRQKVDEARKIFEKYSTEFNQGKLSGRTGMEPVIELVDLFSRSALGGVTDRLSAMVFANFYISELETRYTTPHGTGAAALKMEKMLEKRPKLFTGKANAPVIGLRNTAEGVEVKYNYDGKTNIVRGRHAVFAAQLKLAPRIVENLATDSPEQARLMSDIGYSHYSVHIVEVDGNPYRASYDTWTRASDYSEDDFTDIILGNWMNPKMRGYEGYRDFSKDPPISTGIVSLYQPLPQKWIGKDYSENEARQLALRSVERFRELYSRLPSALWRGELKVKSIETSRWPFSVHIAKPGYISNNARVLRRPFGRIYFANNNLGAPSFEEALFRGHCAAVNILLRTKRGYKPEQWTRCPIEN